VFRVLRKRESTQFLGNNDSRYICVKTTRKGNKKITLCRKCEIRQNTTMRTVRPADVGGLAIGLSLISSFFRKKRSSILLLRPRLMKKARIIEQK